VLHSVASLNPSKDVENSAITVRIIHHCIVWPKPKYTPGYSLVGGILWPVTPGN